jgi:Response regulator of the LytR/AlgR family
MRLLRCIIVDDEPLALDLIENYVRRTPFLELVGRCSSPFQAMEVMNNQNIDLLFLDIQMPGLTGLEFSRALQNGPRIIFTTAYGQYALEGFRVDALDYLVKPFNYEEFLKAANKSLTWFTMVERGNESKAEDSPKSLLVKSGYRLVRVDIDDILYIEGLKDYVQFFLISSDKPVVAQITLKSLEEKLPESKFFRVHRSFIVSIDKITTIERSRIVFGKTYIPISDSVKEQFLALIDKRFIH